MGPVRKETFSIYLPSDLKAWLKAEALRQDQTLTKLIFIVLRDYRETKENGADEPNS